MSGALSVTITLLVQVLLLGPAVLLLRGQREALVLGAYIIGAASLAVLLIGPLSGASDFPEMRAAADLPEAQCRRILQIAAEAGIVSTGPDGEPVLNELPDSAVLPEQVQAALQACVSRDEPQELQALPDDLAF